jgi:DNA-binding MarR family transcriptional regulator
MSDGIARLISDSARLIKREFEARARSLGITREQAFALVALSRNEGVNQVRLAELMEMDAIPLFRLVDRLEASGLVRRERDPADRRARRLYLTQAGWTTLDLLRPLMDQLGHDVCAGIDPEEIATFRKVLARMVANLAPETDAGRGE